MDNHFVVFGLDDNLAGLVIVLLTYHCQQNIQIGNKIVTCKKWNDNDRMRRKQQCQENEPHGTVETMLHSLEINSC